MNNPSDNPATAAAIEQSNGFAAEQFDNLVAEVVELIEAGEEVSVDQLTADCPHLREQLEQLLPTLQAMASLGHSSLGHESKPANATVPQTGVLGDFRIVQEIGRGGMGVVYEAEQISLGRRVALKVLPYAALLDQRQLARFKNEARAAATLDHPHIVAVYSVGSERSVHYYAMQLVEGQSLAEVLSDLRSSEPTKLGNGTEQHPASDADAASREAEIETEPIAAAATVPDCGTDDYFRMVARLGIQAAEALDYAHENGIIHRDVKPGNLLVNADGKLWVTDFGLARIEADPGMTMTGDFLGTLRYMSPEQARGKRAVVDHRTDIYSLGATLYELLTLSPPFTGADHGELLQQVVAKEPRPARQLATRLPVELERIVAMAMEKEPADRYDSAGELADDLNRYLQKQPVVGRRPRLQRRVFRWLQRHPKIAAVALLIAVTWLVAAHLIAAATFRLQQAANREVSVLKAERDFATSSLFVVEELLKKNDANLEATLGPVPDEIRQLYVEAVDARTNLIQQNPQSIDYVLDGATTISTYGGLLALRGNLDAASDEMAKALDLIGTLKTKGRKWQEPAYSQLRINNIRRTACAVFRKAGKTETALRYARPLGMTAGNNGLLYVSSRGLDSVLKVDPKAGQLVGELRMPQGVLSPHGLAFAPNGPLFVCSESEDCLIHFDSRTGQCLGTFRDDVPHPVGIAVGQDDDLFVSCFQANEVRRYSIHSGALLAMWGDKDTGKLVSPTGLALGPDGGLYVACQYADHVLRCSLDGEKQEVFASGDGLDAPIHLAFGPDNDLYVVGLGSGSVHRFDGKTGVFKGVVAELYLIEGLAFDASGALFVNSGTQDFLMEVNVQDGSLRRVVKD